MCTTDRRRGPVRGRRAQRSLRPPPEHEGHRKNTLTPKKPLPAGVVLGESTELSAGDIATVKAMDK
ncbi:hypothetical protein [Kitasatospora sp. NPDC101183]|uniref:hypothetical protein n=1 Tax=Kitasatospora sp. NPDC101183 TaxID=3364100 RepID=UPI00381ECE04